MAAPAARVPPLPLPPRHSLGWGRACRRAKASHTLTPWPLIITTVQAVLEEVHARTARAPRLSRVQRQAVVQQPLTERGEAALLQRIKLRLDR